MRIRQSGPAFRLGAWDTDPTPPTITSPTDTSVSGRGLHLINAYADDWGWFRVNGTNGKYVWCEPGTKPD
ncbi:hypothetical protein JIX56_21330 [Streptomyces sp. CA-210063]|uniref:hypothetical protein n=1 Tax=Streptomyces sp. CA-210063 TaxID=2801029 RepID=UPI00214BC542|nr:hypothetical protein [Streptomyces sp. CA-210063]UUU32243.1 hypothetical protein JIX56_21330 [Streptomyces sp. CA-210063]